MKESVLVTGGAGYIGSHTVQLLKKTHRVVVIDNLERGHTILPGVEYHHCDLRDVDAVTAVMGKEAVRCVLHFAAYAYVGESMSEPEWYFRNNVVNTLNLLTAMRSAGVRNLVFSSSCTVYGIPTSLPITEESPISPISPYGESKAMSERLLLWHDHAYGIRSVSLRYFNAAGADPEGVVPGECHDPEPHVIPRLLGAALGKEREFQVMGTDYSTEDGTCIRDYIHVVDLADAHCRAMDYLRNTDQSGVFNLGTGHGISVRELIRVAEDVTGLNIPWKAVPRRPGDPAALVADPRRAREILGWTPKWSEPLQILRTAWQWYQSQAKSSQYASAAGAS